MDIREKLLYLTELFPRLKYAVSTINRQLDEQQFNKFDIELTSNGKGDISSWGIHASKGRGKPRLNCIIYDGKTSKSKWIKWKE